MNRPNVFHPMSLDSTTHFRANGNIDIEPCHYEQDKAPIMGTERVSVRARVITHDDGSVSIKPYRDGRGGLRHTVVYRTANCEIRLLPSGRIVIKWNFPPEIPMVELYETYLRENTLIQSFLLTTKQTEVWQTAA